MEARIFAQCVNENVAPQQSKHEIDSSSVGRSAVVMSKEEFLVFRWCSNYNLRKSVCRSSAGGDARCAKCKSDRKRG